MKNINIPKRLVYYDPEIEQLARMVEERCHIDVPLDNFGRGCYIQRLLIDVLSEGPIGDYYDPEIIEATERHIDRMFGALGYLADEIHLVPLAEPTEILYQLLEINDGCIR